MLSRLSGKKTQPPESKDSKNESQANGTNAEPAPIDLEPTEPRVNGVLDDVDQREQPVQSREENKEPIERKKRRGKKKIVDQNLPKSEIRQESTHERVLAVIIHRTDRIKSKPYIAHPLVKVHVVNATTGEYVKKSCNQRAVAYVNETMPLRADAVDYILPIMTKPSDFRIKDLPAPTWEELLLFNDNFQHFVEPQNQTMIMFELLDFKNVHAIKRAQNGENDNLSGSGDNLDGWHRIAWAFLKLVGKNGTLNIGQNLRLQLYKAPQTTKIRDQRQPEVYHWWRYIPKIKYAGTLFVAVKPIDHPHHVPAATRSMFAVQQETVSGQAVGPNSPRKSTDDGTQSGPLEDKKIEEVPFMWSRLPGQQCKVPNKLRLSLTCGRGGCFRVKFSPTGRYLAGAGAEHQLSRFPIYVYGFPTGKYLGLLFGHVQLVYELSWNNSELLSSASADCTARIWDISQMICSNILTHATFVYCARFHPGDDKLIFTGSFDKRIRLWSIESEKPRVIQEFEPHSSYVNCLCFTGDQKFLYSGDGAGAVRIWASADNSKDNWMFLKELKEDRLMGKPINTLEVHPDQKRLFIQSRDGCVRSMEIRSLALRAHYRGSHNADTYVRGDLSPCGTFYFAGDGEGQVLVWHIQSTQICAQYDQLSIARCPVTSVSYHPFDHLVAFSLYGSRQPILVYKHDPSVPELYKEEVLETKVEKPRGPTFDPDYSLAKLLAEHRLLTKFELPSGKWSETGQRSMLKMPTNVQSGPKILKPSSPTPDASMSSTTSKRVTFEDAIRHRVSSTQRNRQAIFARDAQQSTHLEIPLREASTESNDDETTVLEQRDLENIAMDGEIKSEPKANQSNRAGPFQTNQSIERSQPTQSKTNRPINRSTKDRSLDAQENSAVQESHESVLVSASNVIGQKNDMIKIVKRDDLWWVGYVDPEKIGYFPANYVAEIE